MSQFNVSLDIKDRFFDRARVVKWMEQHDKRALARSGAFIRRRAVTDVLRRTIPASQRRRAGRNARSGQYDRIRQSATAGNPPVVHSRNKYANLRNILFGLDMVRQSVQIGPIGIASLRLKGGSRETVPELMEFGGTAVVHEYRFTPTGEWQLGEVKSAPFRRSRSTTYAPHPFMSVALEREVAAGTVLDQFASVHN